MMANKKLYYSISEVAAMFEVKLSTLRYWEREINQLKPRRNDRGTRFYTQKDIQLIKQIIYLCNEQHFTIEGVKKKLSNQLDETATQHELYERLVNIRKRLNGVRKQLEKLD